MLEQRDGWYVVNVRDAPWRGHPDFCRVTNFGGGDGPFTDIGINLMLLEPGKPACRYHRESAQEDFLVLSGRCKLLVNEEERELGAWDFVHCPPGVTHVFVGSGNGPCALLAIGHRQGAEHRLFYPQSPLAARYDAQSPQPTDDPRVAYGDRPPPQPVDAPEWPPA